MTQTRTEYHDCEQPEKSPVFTCCILEINIFRVTTLFPKRVSWTIDLWNEVSRLFMLIFITPLYFVKKQIKLSKLSPFYCHTGSSSEKCASDFSIEISFLVNIKYSSQWLQFITILLWFRIRLIFKDLFT